MGWERSGVVAVLVSLGHKPCAHPERRIKISSILQHQRDLETPVRLRTFPPDPRPVDLSETVTGSWTVAKSSSTMVPNLVVDPTRPRRKRRLDEAIGPERTGTGGIVEQVGISIGMILETGIDHAPSARRANARER